MRKFKILTLAALPPLLFTGPLWAQDWSFPAAQDANYQAQPTLALLGGIQDPDVRGAGADSLMGIELSLNCPLIQPPKNRIRQQLSLSRYDDSGLELTSLEINPHYMMPLSEHLELGVGPGLGIVRAEAGRDEETLYTAQAGASLQYRVGALYLGAEARYQLTTEDSLGGRDRDVDNSRFLLKVGLDI